MVAFSKKKKTVLLFFSIGVSLANIVDDATSRAKYGHRIAIGHLKEDGKHLNQMGNMAKSHTKLNVVTSSKRV